MNTARPRTSARARISHAMRMHARSRTLDVSFECTSCSRSAGVFFFFSVRIFFFWPFGFFFFARSEVKKKKKKKNMDENLIGLTCCLTCWSLDLSLRCLKNLVVEITFNRGAVSSVGRARHRHPQGIESRNPQHRSCRGHVFESRTVHIFFFFRLGKKKYVSRR
jgi:hypothetical protein